MNLFTSAVAVYGLYPKNSYTAVIGKDTAIDLNEYDCIFIPERGTKYFLIRRNPKEIEVAKNRISLFLRKDGMAEFRFAI